MYVVCPYQWTSFVVKEEKKEEQHSSERQPSTEVEVDVMDRWTKIVIMKEFSRKHNRDETEDGTENQIQKRCSFGNLFNIIIIFYLQGVLRIVSFALSPASVLFILSIHPHSSRFN